MLMPLRASLCVLCCSFATRPARWLHDSPPPVSHTHTSQAGKLPTQSQIDSAIDALTSKRSILSPDRRKGEGKLSENGRTILEDVKTILQKLKTWSDSKNKGDVLQELIYHTKRGSLDADGDVNIGG